MFLQRNIPLWIKKSGDLWNTGRLFRSKHCVVGYLHGCLLIFIRVGRELTMIDQDHREWYLTATLFRQSGAGSCFD